MSSIYRYAVEGCGIIKSKIYHGRYECYFYGTRGVSIKKWVRETFGENDDLVYTSDDIDGSNVGEGCGSLITKEQLTLLLLRRS